MNTQQDQTAMYTKTMFEQLAELHLRIIMEGKAPFQWIFAVDDAWLHPSGVSAGELKPLFPFDLSGKTIPIAPGFLSTNASTDGESSSSFVPGMGSSPTQSTPIRANNNTDDYKLKVALEGNGGGQNDPPTAKTLIKFILDHEGEYGLCICSFEYFWQNISEINQPQNSVFFDLKHQLASEIKGDDKGGVAAQWTQLLSDLFPNNAGNMDRLGWMLHYALKFGTIPGAPRRHVDHNHLLIISSAIAPQAAAQAATSNRLNRDAVAEFLDIQAEIFASLTPPASSSPTVSSRAIASVMPDMFSWAPLPKRSEGDQVFLQTGLTIFNNSFKNAGTWEGVRRYLFADAKLLWRNNCDFGHNPPANGHGLHCDFWRPLNFSKIDSAKAIYWFWNDRGEQLKSVSVWYSMFKGLLNASLVHRHFKLFDVDIPGPDFQVSIPTNPAFVWIATFIDFLDKLKPEKKADEPERSKPSLAIIKEDANIKIIVTLDGNGITGLQKAYETGKCNKGCATAALLHAVKNINQIGDHDFGGLTLTSCIEKDTNGGREEDFAIDVFADSLWFNQPTVAITLKLG